MSSPLERAGLLVVLTRLGGSASAADLLATLGVSRATLSRAVSEAGPELLRYGRARATRYARLRNVEGVGWSAPVRRVDAKGGLSEPVAQLHFVHGPHQLWAPPTGAAQFFVGLPPALADMSPQGYLGRTFSQRHPGLPLPARITDWSDDHRLIALCRRGEDCAGDLIVGTESLDRYLASTLEEVSPADYPALAKDSAQSAAGSSAAGEQPKFTAFRKGRHRLVKFAGSEGGQASARWQDLLAAEALALKVVREAGHPTAHAELHDRAGMRFLEVERFDRVGERGRRGLLSFAALNAEYVGANESWTDVAEGLVAAGRLTADELRRVRWLDAFGQLIGNSDRHLGNLSVFAEPDGALSLAPLYDMLPMVFSPVGAELPERAFVPSPPSARNVGEWPDAARWALRYWEELCRSDALSSSFRALCKKAKASVEARVKASPV